MCIKESYFGPYTFVQVLIHKSKCHKTRDLNMEQWQDMIGFLQVRHTNV